jgi:dTMP kinase
MASGTFVTFEGGEGTGKTTQIARLKHKLDEAGLKSLVTREPGGTPEAERIRSEILGSASAPWSALGELLLMYAARESHLRHVIRPALAQGVHVLCDRFMDSSRAYQGYAGGVSLALIDRLESEIVGDTRPDLTLVFDLDPVTGLDRARSRQGATSDRFERMELGFHEALRAGFLAIAAKDPGRCVVIDAAADEAGVFDAVWRAVAPVLPARP